MSFSDFVTRSSPFVWTFNVGMFFNLALSNAMNRSWGLAALDVALMGLSVLNARMNLAARDRLVRDAD